MKDFFKKYISQLSLLGILLSFVYVSLVAWLRVDLSASGHQALLLNNSDCFGMMTLLVLVSVFFYGLIWRLNIKSSDIPVIWCWFMVFGLIYLFSSWQASIDVYSYLGWGRITAVWHSNPYLINYSSLSSDIFFGQINNYWLSLTLPYGPIFSVLATIIAYLAGDSLRLGVVLFKVVALIATGVIGWTLYRMTSSRKILLIWLWSPLIIFYLVAEAHSEAILLALIFLSFYFLRQAGDRYYRLAVGFFVASVLFKYISLLLLPLYLIYQARYRRRQTWIIWLLAVAVTVLFCFIFGPNVFGGMSQLASADELVINYPNLMVMIMSGFALMQGSMDLELSKLFILGSRIVFVAFYLYWLVGLIKLKELDFQGVLKSSALVMIAFFVTWPIWVMPWYLITPLAILLLLVGYRPSRVMLISLGVIGFLICLGALTVR